MQGITKRAIYKGEERRRPAAPRSDRRPRRARDDRNPMTDELIVAENQITEAAAEKIEALGIESVVVRSPLTCEAPPTASAPHLLRHGHVDRADGRAGPRGRHHRRPVDR